MAGSRLLDRLARGRVALGSLVALVVFMATVLPWQAEKAEEYSGGASSPDTGFFYTAADSYAAAEAFGPDGRADYVFARYTFDVVWPLVYALTISLMLSWVLGRLLRADSRWRLLNLLPWLALVLDYLENLSAIVVFGRYPDETPVVADVATVFTMGKWVSLYAALGLVILGAIVVLGRRLTGRQGPPATPLRPTG